MSPRLVLVDDLAPGDRVHSHGMILDVVAVRRSSDRYHWVVEVTPSWHPSLIVPAGAQFTRAQEAS